MRLRLSPPDISARPWLVAWLLAGCGVAGQPLPPGPVPPGAPGSLSARATPTGFEIQAQPPRTDVDGQPLAGPIEWLLYADRPECTGRPDARAAGEAPLHLDRTEGEIIVRVVAARGGRQGAPSPPFALRWTPPPPPPEAPLAFADGRAQVVVNWLPPDAPTVRVLRDGAVVAEVAAAEAGFTDAPPPGRHRYAIEAQGPDFRTAASPETAVTVP